MIYLKIVVTTTNEVRVKLVVSRCIGNIVCICSRGCQNKKDTFNSAENETAVLNVFQDLKSKISEKSDQN